MPKETHASTTYSQFASKIKELRVYLNLSLAAFAEPIGLSPTHIARFERGISIPSPKTIDAICKAYGVDRKYFALETGTGPSAVVGLNTQSTSISVEEAVDKKNPNAEIAARLSSAHQLKGWSQNELAKHSGVRQPNITRVESGAKLTMKQAAKVAEALEVGVDWLLRGDICRKNYPADRKLIDWLWEHEEIRLEIWKRMKES